MDAPAVRERVVGVVAALGDELDVEAAIELVRIGERLLDVADQEVIGAGTTRAAMGRVAVYATDRLTEGQELTQAQVVEAAPPRGVDPVYRRSDEGLSRRAVLWLFRAKHGRLSICFVHRAAKSL